MFNPCSSHFQIRDQVLLTVFSITQSDHSTTLLRIQNNTNLEMLLILFT